MSLRIGQGLDIHPIDITKDHMILGGKRIPHEFGLKGHSDADALSHAICDALLGAANLGDIGTHFSDKDEKWKGQNSLFFCEHVSKLLKERLYDIVNIDATILTEVPMINPHVAEMKKNLSQSLGIQQDQISLKATRPEQLGALGRREGLLVQAVALIQKHA